ncbi:MAG TPA: glycosyltransferase family 1 protein [Blastocatellia bacterium]|nr:glycosyltransferase family 1 protein [Blastocatellia bacterium]
MRIGIDGIPLAELKTGVGHYTFEIALGLARQAPSDSFEILSHLPFAQGAVSDVPNLSFIEQPVNQATRHWWTIGLPLYIKRARLDLFHGTNYDVPVWGGCPTVLTIHDLSQLLFPETHEERRVRRARRRLPVMSRRATMIITPTEAVKSEVCEQLRVPRDKVVVVNEAPRRSFQPMPLAEASATVRRLGIDEEFILYVGTIEPRKNLITLVKAFQEVLRSTTLRPQLVIAGKKGWLTEELFAYIDSAKLGDRLCLTGYLGDDELRALYSACSVMVYPALYEGAGLPTLEAMACGAPVITTNTPAIVEMVGDKARLFSPADFRGLAEHLVELLTTPAARESMSREGIQHAARFTWERAAQETMKIYRQVTGNIASTVL